MEEGKIPSLVKVYKKDKMSLEVYDDLSFLTINIPGYEDGFWDFDTQEELNIEVSQIYQRNNLVEESLECTPQQETSSHLPVYCFCQGTQTRTLRFYVPVRSINGKLKQVCLGTLCPSCGKTYFSFSWLTGIKQARLS